MSELWSIIDTLKQNSTIQWISTFIFTVVVSTYVSWFFGARWSDMRRFKKQHSEVLRDKSLSHWYHNNENYAPLTVRFNEETEMYESYPQQDLMGIDYGEQLVQHMESGYPDLIEQWESYKVQVTKHNEIIASLYNEIMDDLKKWAENLGLRVVYRINGIDDPDTYVGISEIVKILIEVYEEKRTRKRNGDFFKFSVNIETDKKYSLFWESRGIMEDYKNENIELIKIKLNQIFDNTIYYNKYLNMKEDEEIVKKLRLKFMLILNKVIKEIDLGINIKGKCNLCNNLF